jgi:NADH:ubiquinone oxidoreductase subunit 6 (subunit J)
MNLINFLFLGFSSNLILSSIFTITASNSVYALISLIFLFINAAGLFFLMNLEFIGILFLIVYVGAIAVLFLFSVMMFNIKDIVKTSSVSFALKLTYIVIGLFVFFSIIYLFSLNIFFIEKESFLYLNIIKDKESLAYPKGDRALSLITQNVGSLKPRVHSIGYYKFAKYFNGLELKEYNYSLNKNLLNTFINSTTLNQNYLYNLSSIKTNELLALSFLLYNKFAVYLILVTLILLISMIGAIVLILMPKEKLELQHSSRQISKKYMFAYIK